MVVRPTISSRADRSPFRPLPILYTASCSGTAPNMLSAVFSFPATLKALRYRRIGLAEVRRGYLPTDAFATSPGLSKETDPC
jgi:hypothetical protein